MCVYINTRYYYYDSSEKSFAFPRINEIYINDYLNPYMQIYLKENFFREAEDKRSIPFKDIYIW